MQAVCETCIHFCQHYIKRGRRYLMAGSGHCTYPMIKPRKSSTPACKHYQPRPEAEEEPRA